MVGRHSEGGQAQCTVPTCAGPLKRDAGGRSPNAALTPIGGKYHAKICAVLPHKLLSRHTWDRSAWRRWFSRWRRWFSRWWRRFPWGNGWVSRRRLCSPGFSRRQLERIPWRLLSREPLRVWVFRLLALLRFRMGLSLLRLSLLSLHGLFIRSSLFVSILWLQLCVHRLRSALLPTSKWEAVLSNQIDIRQRGLAVSELLVHCGYP